MAQRFRPTKKFLRLQLILRIIVLAALTMGVYFAVYFFAGWEMNYFLEHFGVALTLVLIGLVALLLPILNSWSNSPDNKGDKLMMIIGACLILFGIASLIYSYL